MPRLILVIAHTIHHLVNACTWKDIFSIQADELYIVNIVSEAVEGTNDAFTDKCKIPVDTICGMDVFEYSKVACRWQCR